MAFFAVLIALAGVAGFYAAENERSGIAWAAATLLCFAVAPLLACLPLAPLQRQWRARERRRRIYRREWEASQPSKANGVFRQAWLNLVYGTQLRRAAEDGNTDRIRQLLDKGVGVDVGRSTALESAVLGQHIDAVELLLDNGAYVDGRRPDSTPLFLAVSHATYKAQFHPAEAKGPFDLVKLLVSRGADLAAQTRIGDTVVTLNMRSDPGVSEILEYLIKKGCPVDACNNDEETALMCALDKGNLTIAELLLELGAEPRLTTTRWESPDKLKKRKWNLERLLRKQSCLDSETRAQETKQQTDGVVLSAADQSSESAPVRAAAVNDEDVVDVEIDVDPGDQIGAMAPLEGNGEAIDEREIRVVAESADPDDLVALLVAIARKEGFLSQSPGGAFDANCHHKQARRIGKILNAKGGMTAMRSVGMRVAAAVPDQSRHLEYCWDGIGNWHG
jgi:ankyrin repeat protein